MGSGTRQEVLAKPRRRYPRAGRLHPRKLVDQAVKRLGYHRKSAIIPLAAAGPTRVPRVNTGRPALYVTGVLTPWRMPIRQATDFDCGRSLAAMPDLILAYEAHERSPPGDVREWLLLARLSISHRERTARSTL